MQSLKKKKPPVRKTNGGGKGAASGGKKATPPLVKRPVLTNNKTLKRRRDASDEDGEEEEEEEDDDEDEKKDLQRRPLKKKSKKKVVRLKPDSSSSDDNDDCDKNDNDNDDVMTSSSSSKAASVPRLSLQEEIRRKNIIDQMEILRSLGLSTEGHEKQLAMIERSLQVYDDDERRGGKKSKKKGPSGESLSNKIQKTEARNFEMTFRRQEAENIAKMIDEQANMYKSQVKLVQLFARKMRDLNQQMEDTKIAQSGGVPRAIKASALAEDMEDDEEEGDEDEDDEDDGDNEEDDEGSLARPADDKIRKLVRQVETKLEKGLSLIAKLENSSYKSHFAANYCAFEANKNLFLKVEPSLTTQTFEGMDVNEQKLLVQSVLTIYNTCNELQNKFSAQLN